MNNSGSCGATGHRYAMDETDGGFQQAVTDLHQTGRCENPGICRYESGYMIHYWLVVSAGLDKPGVEQISDQEFDWFNAFLTTMNKQDGHIAEKVELINYALDQMHWDRPPKVTMHNPDYDLFIISFKEGEERQFDWDFYEAVAMMQKMNGYLDRLETEAMVKEQIDLQTGQPLAPPADVDVALWRMLMGTSEIDIDLLANLMGQEDSDE